MSSAEHEFNYTHLSSLLPATSKFPAILYTFSIIIQRIHVHLLRNLYQNVPLKIKIKRSSRSRPYAALLSAAHTASKSVTIKSSHSLHIFLRMKMNFPTFHDHPLVIVISSGCSRKKSDYQVFAAFFSWVPFGVCFITTNNRFYSRDALLTIIMVIPGGM